MAQQRDAKSEPAVFGGVPRLPGMLKNS